MENVPFYNPDLRRGHEPTGSQSYYEVLSILDDLELQREIDAGNVTLAIIRPNVGPEANIENLPDLEAADNIEKMIEGLGIMAKFSFRFSEQAADEFYGGSPKEKMISQEPQDPTKYSSKFEEFISVMASGDSTVLILHSPDGQAISKWRTHLGHWNIEKFRDPTTIRGRFGSSNYNNLAHGSDSPEAVKRELSIIEKCLVNQS